MTPTAPLEIKVIYSASARRSRRGKAAGTARVPTGSRAARRGSWTILGIMNLAVAGALCYGTWWRVDPYLYVTMIMRTPVVNVDLDAAATQMFGIPPKEATSVAPMPAVQGKPPRQPQSQSERAGPLRNEAARVVIPVSAYTWLTLATISCCAVAFSGGASLGRAGGRSYRVLGVVGTCGGVLALAWAGWQVWNEYGWQFRPTHLRVGYSLLVLLIAFAGMIVARGARRLSRWAAVLLILSAGGSVGGLILGALAGAIPAEQSTPTYLAIVFIIHSLYGWILLPVSSRIGR